MPITIEGTGTITGATTLASTVASPTFTTPALGTPASGALTNCTGYAAANFPAGTVLNVLSITKTNSFSSASTSFTDITDLTISITPTSASNKILVLANVSGSQDVAVGASYLRLMRDSTAICIGDTAGSRPVCTFGIASPATSILASNTGMNFLDSPGVTTSTTYKIQCAVTAGSGSTYINRTTTDSDSASFGRGVSSITVMDIKG